MPSKGQISSIYNSLEESPVSTSFMFLEIALADISPKNDRLGL